MSWGIIFFVWIAIVAVAILWTGQSMKISGKIKIGWFVGQDIKMEKCRDVKGFINATYPKIMSFGMVALVGACVLIVLEAYKVSAIGELIIMVLLIVLYFVFNRDLKKATKKYLL